MNESTQTLFLNGIKENLSSHISFSDELAETLNISRDSAYRRIRGETILSLDEAKVLYHRYGVSLDKLFNNNSEMVTFHRRVVSYDEYGIAKWLKSLLKNFEHLSSFKKHEMIFSAKDIPVFHYFRIPELSAFKLFFWSKTLLGDPAYESRKFSLEAVPKELVALASRVWDKYATIPSTEIWNEVVLYDILKQIEFYEECNFFESKSEAARLCDQVLLLIKEIESDAAAGTKTEGGTFNLYNNEILISDNTVFARMGEQRCVYVNQNALNLLLTLQEPFCEKTEKYLQNLIQQSTCISVTGQRERSRFFKNMSDRVNVVKEKLPK